METCIVFEMSFERHRPNSHISIDRCVKSRVVELGRELDAGIAVYLDTNFWILLRKAALGVDSKDAILELLDLLRKGVADGKLFCPISETIFLELLKQSDTSSRVATA